MTKADLDELLTMAFMRGAESVGLEALAFAERLSTHPTLSDYEIELGQRVMRMFAEQLGKDEAWALGVLRAVRGEGLSSTPGECTVRERLTLVEGDCSYNGPDKRVLRTAYRAALEAEESRQAAERAQAEPVCPDAVKAAEDARQDALNALAAATKAHFSAEDDHRAAQVTLARADAALRAARREAGL